MEDWEGGGSEKEGVEEEGRGWGDGEGEGWLD